ncbi:MAG: TolA-binding protein [Myxococcota bacterium]|jgi:TolA-binding protein
MITGITFCLMFALPQQAGSDLLASKNADAARAITAEFGLDYWSEKLVERSLATATSADGKSDLLLARCDVLRMVAGRKLDDLERLFALGEAGTAYTEYLESNPSSSRATKAQSNLGILAFIYGQTLVQLINGGSITAEDVAKASEEADVIFKAALKGMNSVISWWENLGDDDPEKASSEYTDYLPSVYNRALVYRYWAELFDEGSIDREQKAEKAIDLLSEFALGAPFLPQQRAYSALADCYAVIGEYEDATDYYLYVSQRVNDLIEQEGSTLGLNYIALLQDASQEAVLGLVKMFQRNGDAAMFWETFNQFEAWVTENDVTVSRTGSQVRLAAAEQMINEGRSAEAIDLAAAVAAANERNLLRLQANSIMGRAISLAPADAKISLDILYSAAEGAYFQKRFDDAIDGFRLLAPRLDSDDEQYGAKTYYYLGLSWAKLDEALLAMVSHQVGYQTYPNDEEYALKNAEKWQKAAESLSLANPGDEILREFNGEATQAVKILGGGGDNLEWNQAKQLLDLAKASARVAKGKEVTSSEFKKAAAAYQRAIDALSSIPVDNDFYEYAMVTIGVAEYNASDFDATASKRSVDKLNEYLNDYITDANNDPQDPLQRKVRKDKEPEAVFYLGLAQRKDNNHLAVLTSFEGFSERYPDQASLAHATMTYRIEAYIALDDVDSAIAEYESMHANSASDSRLSIGAYYIYLHYRVQTEAAIGEDRLASLELQAKYIHDFNKYAADPRWQNLLGEADLLTSLSEFKDAGKLYELILTKHAKSSDFSDSFKFKTQIGFVESLLAQRQIGKAVPLINAMLESRPSNLRVKTAAVKVKAGFLLYINNRIVEVPGEGTEEALTTASGLSTEIIRLAAYQADNETPSINKFFYPDWWEAQVTHGYVLYQRNLTSPADLGAHKKFVEGLMRQAPELGEDVVGPRVSESLKWILNR